MLNRKDWTLLAIAGAKEKGLSPVQLQKTLFLLGRQMPEAVGTDFYDFKPYHYGPFDEDVSADARALAKSGDIEITRRPDENWNRYVVTPEGVRRAETLAREIVKAADYLQRLLDWVQRQTFQSLVTAIYAKYPEMRVNSVFQQQ